MNEIFGKRFKQLRTELDLNQQDLVDDFNAKFNYSFTRVAISQYENGKRIPEVDALASFAQYFGVSVDYLLGRSDNRNNDLYTKTAESNKHKNDIEKIIDEILHNNSLTLGGEQISGKDLELLKNSLRSTIDMAKNMNKK